MTFEPKIIGQYDIGFEEDVEPFCLPEKAWTILEDCYVWRGRLLRRDGYSFDSRLRRVFLNQAIGNISSADTSFNLFTALGITEPNAQIESGALTTISIVIAAPISETLTINLNTSTFTLNPGTNITSATLDYSTGIITLVFSGVFAPSAAVFSGAYYPGLPVMGIKLYDQPSINDETTIAFDTKYSYARASGTWIQIGTTTWNGTDYQFFWTTNYYKKATRDLIWATNFAQNVPPYTTTDPIRYWDGTGNWVDFKPDLNDAGTTQLQGALLITPFKDRLCFFGTFEDNAFPTTQYFRNRLRFSWNGDPLDAKAFVSDVAGKGGFIDAPTNEAINSIAFVKDRLIAYFEMSTWEVVYTGNELLPFVFQKLDAELGSESPFSSIQFDKSCLAIGSVGIHSCNGVAVERIDAVIPDFVFTIRSADNAIFRVSGIRDFTRELVYWTIPVVGEDPSNTIYPQKTLVYNYRNHTFGTYNDYYTTFGYLQRTNDLTWATLPYDAWTQWLDPWNSGEQLAGFHSVMGGNQQGYIVNLSDSQFENDTFLHITAISIVTVVNVSTIVITSPNHNLNAQSFVRIMNTLGTVNLNFRIFKIVSTTTNTFTIVSNGIIVSGTYTGLGEIQPLNNINAVSKVFTPYWKEGTRVGLGYIDWLFDRTPDGQVTINIFIDTNYDSAETQNVVAGVMPGTNTVLTTPDPFFPGQANQSQIWHRQYYDVEGQTIQYQITMSDDQMFDNAIQMSDITMHSTIIWIQPRGSFP